MTVKGIRCMALVRDIDAAVRFYRDVVCLTLVAEEEEWAAFAEGFGVMSGADGLPDDDLRISAVQVCFMVDSVDEWYGRLVARGVPFMVLPCDMGDGRLAAFRDPEGLVVQVMQADR